MMRNLMVGCLLSFIFVITSCSLKPFVIVYNNSGHDIRIVAGSNDCQLRTAESIKLPFSNMVGKLIIINGKLELKYIVKFPPEIFAENKLFENLYLLQIEKDGSIYVLKPKTSVPTDKLDSQPNGFPLKPENN